MKSHLQTAFERMTDEELNAIYGLAADRTKGAAARLLVIEGQVEMEQQIRGTKPSPKGVSLMADEAEGKALLIKGVRLNQTTHAEIVEGTTNPMRNLDDTAFSAAIRAIYGINDFFGDGAMRAIKGLDESFFESAIKAIEAMKSKIGIARSDGGDSKMLKHVRAALIFLNSRDEDGIPPDDKTAKKELREFLEQKLGEDAFAPKSESWPEFFRRPEIAPYMKKSNAGGRPTTSGKGRGIEDFDLPGI